MGRRPSAISEKKPGRELALFLRRLKCSVGDPSYRKLGKIANFSHTTLSQTADGRYVRWMRVEEFLHALELYCGSTKSGAAITPQDKLRARQLHAEATELHRQIKAAVAASNRLLWRQTDRDLREPGQIAALTRAPGNWKTTWVGRVHGLNVAATRGALAGVLHDLIVRAGITVEDLRAVGLRGWDGRARQLERLPVSAVRWLATTAGGTEGDRLVWEAAWERTEADVAVPRPRGTTPPGDAIAADTFPQWGPPEDAFLPRPVTWVLRPTWRGSDETR